MKNGVHFILKEYKYSFLFLSRNFFMFSHDAVRAFTNRTPAYSANDHSCLINFFYHPLYHHIPFFRLNADVIISIFCKKYGSHYRKSVIGKQFN